jgi:phospholipid/cholesterol/gamma-HCH transport system substrate-binding protein
VKISNETKVGILATFAIVIVILGVNFLKGKNVFSRNIILYSKYKDVQNLTASNPVILHGLQVGQVDGLELIHEDSFNVMVKFHIYGGVDVPKNSVAKIISSDLLGSKAMEIIPGDLAKVKSTEKWASRNDTLKGLVEISLTESVNKVVAPVKDKVEKLISSVDTIVTTLNVVFNEADLRASFASLKGTLADLKEGTGKLNMMVDRESSHISGIMRSVDDISANIRDNNAAISRIIDNFASISDSLRAANLKQTLARVNDAVGEVNRIVEGVQNGDGSLGKLLKDDKLYANLESASKQLDKLVLDIKRNPGRYMPGVSLIRVNRVEKEPKDTTGTRP